MKVLVTGGGGFLGRYVVKKLLDRGDSVRVLGRSDQPDLREMGVEMVLGDLADLSVVRKACEGVDVVQHTAAKAGIWGKWDDYFKANVTGTVNIITQCRELGIKKLVYTSTPSVVFSESNLRGVDESQPYGSKWLCHYAHTKMLAEKEVLSANDPEGTGLRTVALRPHLIWGLGDNHLIPRIVKSVQAGRLKIVGEGNNTVDMVHVSNAADAQLLAQDALNEGRCCGKAYFISDDNPVKVWEWTNKFLEQVGLPRLNKKISFKAAYRIGTVMEGFWKCLFLGGEPPMTRFVATELAKDHYFDISAAKRDFGYRPTTSPKEGLSEIVEYWNEKLEVGS